jgi:site-specific DNA-methyltransferase (adenine-specific)
MPLRRKVIRVTIPAPEPEQDSLIVGNNIDVLRTLRSDSIDLIVTSPPYDELRSYNGNYAVNLHDLGTEMFRVLKPGGICCLVMQDQTKNGHKTLTTFKTIIDFCDNVGFGLFETCIYKKFGNEGAWWTKRFRVDHEYMPIFVKGTRPAYFNKEPIKIPCKHANKEMTGCATRLKDGSTLESTKVTINPTKCPGTIWDYSNGGDKNKMKREHPAVFPDKIPYDLIRVFCPPGGIVLDPMSGSGSTVVGAQRLGMRFIGIDIEAKYMDICRRRLEAECGLVQSVTHFAPESPAEQTAPAS